MGRKNLVTPRKLIESQSLAADFQTNPINIETADNMGLWIYASSVTDNTGVFTVQIRPYRNASGEAGDWIALDTTYQLANADANFFRKELSIPNGQIRVSFVAAGGTPNGSVEIWYSLTGN